MTQWGSFASGVGCFCVDRGGDVERLSSGGDNEVLVVVDVPMDIIYM